jgi:hypothetical protein
MISFAERDFRVWHYSVSHSSLLIRSPKDSANLTNVDLLFVGVKYVDLAQKLSGPSLIVGDEADSIAVSRALSRSLSANESVVALVAAGRRNLVVATAFEVQEIEGDIFDSPFDLGPR